MLNMQGDNYNAWNIKETDFPKKESIEKKIEFIIGYGILAPSTHNTQPWVFKIRDKKLEIHPDWNYRLKESDPSDSSLFFSLGCCTTNIELASKYFDLSTSVKLEETPRKGCHITLSFEEKNKTEGHVDLFQLIPYRFSNKMPYLEQAISPEALKKLLGYNSKDVGVDIIANKETLKSLAVLHSYATVKAFTNRNFRKELTNWLRTNFSASYDGMPGFTMGASAFASILSKSIIGILPSKLVGEKEKSLVLSSSAVGVLTTTSNTPQDWVNAGRVYEYIALEAIKNKLYMTPIAAISKDTDSVSKLKDIHQLKNKFVQLLFRIGYSNAKEYHTPRRRANVI